jgi:hypothetical protein
MGEANHRGKEETGRVFLKEELIALLDERDKKEE